jgi:hypothetical protein
MWRTSRAAALGAAAESTEPAVAISESVTIDSQQELQNRLFGTTAVKQDGHSTTGVVIVGKSCLE